MAKSENKSEHIIIYSDASCIYVIALRLVPKPVHVTTQSRTGDKVAFSPLVSVCVYSFISRSVGPVSLSPLTDFPQK